MRKLFHVALLAAVTTAVACGQQTDQVEPAAANGGPKKAVIYFTKNHDPSGQYKTECIGVISPEQIYGNKNQEIIWKIKKNNGESEDDKCENLTFTHVNLRFESNVVSKSPIYAGNNGEIRATVSAEEGDYDGMSNHKYQVFINNDAAGPDPVIVVDCGGCGPPPAPPAPPGPGE